MVIPDKLYQLTGGTNVGGGEVGKARGQELEKYSVNLERSDAKEE